MDKRKTWAVGLLAALCMAAEAVFPAAASAQVPVAPDPVPAAAEEQLQKMDVPAEETDGLAETEETGAPGPAEILDARPSIMGEAAYVEEEGQQHNLASDTEGSVWVQGYNTAQGTISVTVSGTPNGKNVVIEAWPGSLTDAARVYETEPGADGSLSAQIPIADFDYAEGWYSFQGRIGTEEESVPFGEVASAPVAFEHGMLRVEPQDETETAFNVLLQGSSVPDKAIVWLRVRSQDRKSSRVYPLMPRAIGRTYSVFVRNHGKTGMYTATAYLGTPTKISTILGTANFTVDGVRNAKMEFVDVDGSTGTFGMSLAGEAPSGFSSVRFAVWSQKDQSDLQWYDAQEQNGRYTASTSVDAHNGSFGNYRAQAHVALGNGIEMIAAEDTAEITPHNYVYTEKIGDGEYRVAVLAPDQEDVSAFRTACWSEENGQDDVVWYDMSVEDNGEISAVVMPQNHNGTGQYIAHVYMGDKYIGAAFFDVPAIEMLSPAEQRIAKDCQSVYDRVGTDLHDNYMWVVNNLSYIRRYGHLIPEQGYTREQWYAIEGLETESGNCYTFAAAFCELAKGLGYDATYVEGAVYGVGQQWWPHGFVLIRRNGGTYICDPELQYASSTGRNLYMQPISSPKATYRW